MNAFAELGAIGPQDIWQGVAVRAVHGERITLTWRIPANTPHEVVTGPGGAIVIDVFAPTRDDWAAFEPQAPRAPRWP